MINQYLAAQIKLQYSYKRSRSAFSTRVTCALCKFSLALRCLLIEPAPVHPAVLLLQQVLHPCRTIYSLGKKNLFPPGTALYTCSNIYRLAEIIEAVVESYRDGRAAVDADFQDQIAATAKPGSIFAVPSAFPARLPTASTGWVKVAIIASPIVLTTAPCWLQDGLVQHAIMFPHQRKCIQIADLLVQLGGAFQVGEQNGHILHAEAFRFSENFIMK